MNYPDLKAAHTFGNDKKIVPVSHALSTRVEKNGFAYTFPAHSLTILMLHLNEH